MEQFIEHVAYLMANPKGTLWVDTYNAFRSHSVSTAGEAQRLGECVAHKMYSGIVNFNQRSVTHVEDRGNEWEIWFGTPPIPPIDMGNGFVHHTVSLGGGLSPQIRIDKSPGRITSWGLYK